MSTTWPEPTSFVWALFGLTTLGTLLPLDVGRRREDHVVLTITATFVLAVLGPPGLLLVWGSVVIALVARQAGRWLLGTALAITVGFSGAHLTYGVVLDRDYPLAASDGGDLALAFLVLGVAWTGTMSVRVALHHFGARPVTSAAPAGAEPPSGPAAAGAAGTHLGHEPGEPGEPDGFDAFDSPLVPYLLPTVTGAPILAAALALYRPDAPWSAFATLLWVLPLYAACRFDLHRRRLAQQLRRDLVARQRLAAIGEVTARMVHQSRHQAALMGWSIHRLRRLLADPATPGAPGPVAVAAVLELDSLAAAKQRIQGTFDRELLHEPGTPGDDGATTLVATVDDVCAHLAPKADARGVTLTIAGTTGVDGDVPAGTIGVDVEAVEVPGALREALFNVVDNAVDAAATSVRVGGRCKGGEVIVEVDDDGVGIPEAVAARLYEPFFSTKEDGTGMGLAIADALLAELGGRLHHERHASATRFVLTLPTAGTTSQ